MFLVVLFLHLWLYNIYNVSAVCTLTFLTHIGSYSAKTFQKNNSRNDNKNRTTEQYKRFKTYNLQHFPILSNIFIVYNILHVELIRKKFHGKDYISA